jgi:hypothetical protein
MGSQNLLLTFIGIVIVGITIAVAVTMFGANTADANRKAIVSDLQFFAGRARAYYARPASHAGGNHSFVGLTFSRLSPTPQTDNGRFYIESATADELVIVGKGKTLVEEDTVEVRMTMNEKKQTIVMVH